MPRYIIERDLGEMPSQEEFDAGGRKAAQVAASMDGVRWIRSYVCAADGKLYCEYEAPSPEMVLEHARRAGIPVNRISEISVEIEPSMFI